MVAVTKNVSVEFARKKDPIKCILLHPGTVDTDLSRPCQGHVPNGKLFTKEFSVQKLLNIINNAKETASFSPGMVKGFRGDFIVKIVSKFLFVSQLQLLHVRAKR